MSALRESEALRLIGSLSPAPEPVQPPPIYVVLASDSLNRKWREVALEREPNRAPEPIVFETQINGATRERALLHAARAEQQGYPGCRVGRVVFTDEKGLPL